MGLTQITTGGLDGDINIDSNTLKVDGTNNRVGIGTASPSNVLHVHQTDATANSYVHITQADGGSGATDGLSVGIEDGGVNAVIRNRENGYLRMYTNNTERMRIDSSGNVLVGTTTAGGNMTVNMGTDKNISFNGAQGEVGNVPALVAANDAGSSLASMGFRATDLRFATGSAERVRIDSSGNVIIGTTTAATDSRLTVRAVSPALSLYATPGNESFLNMGDTDDHNIGRITYDNSNNAMRFDTNAAERMRIDSSGNVQVSTGQFTVGTTASTGLQFINDGTFGTINSADLKFRTASAERMRIDTSGRLLVGASTGQGNSLLQVEGDSSSAAAQGSISLRRGLNTAAIGGNVGADLGKITFGGNDGTVAAAIASQSDAAWGATSDCPGRILFSTTADGTSSPAERLRISQNGNVGINTTSSSNKLRIHEGSDTPNVVIVTGADESSEFLALGINSGVPCVTAGGVSSTDAALAFRTADNGTESERMRIDSSGRVGIKNSSPGSQYFNDLVIGDGSSDHGITLHAGSSNSSAIAFSDATSGAGRYAGYLQYDHNSDSMRFYTNGGNERARISNDGYFKASNDGSYASTASYHEFRQSNNEQMLLTRASHTSFTENMVILRARRSQTSAYNFLRCQSNDGSDNEFVLRGDGNAYADNSWNGGGADYAEFFEWSDGNAKAEDRRGISVVLDGDKIREAVTGEEPIGVISDNPSVVGDADIERWKGKYLRDDYGSYIQEDYEVEDDDGNTVVQQRRKLNPEYNPDTEYVSREDRPEWDTVGLMGKLRIRKGQVTGTRWIKMRDVSSSVEEWLVR